MKNSDHPVWQLLDEVELAMNNCQLWQQVPPDEGAFNSCEPFFIDTMSATEWLQWLFLPRMRALLDANAPLPTRFALTPYFEEALKTHPDNIDELLMVLKQVDDLLNSEDIEC